MELSRKEIYRNQKVSLGVTLLSFIVMLVFFIFTNIITANPIAIESSTFVASPQIVLSMENGSPASSTSLTEEKKLTSSSSPKESPGSKIQTAQVEIPVEQGATDIVNKYKTSSFVNTSVSTVIESRAPEDTGKQKGEKNTMDVNTGLGFNLTERTIITKPVFSNATQEEGTVVVDILVDKNGAVTQADPNGRGTNTNSSSLKREAAKMALTTKFNSQQTLEEQSGTITIIFSFK